jgi:HK97 family phage prohead protease
MKRFVVKSLNIEESDEEIYVTGYASSTSEDLYGEQITEEALKKAVEQITRPPYNKVFIGHSLAKINRSFEDEIPIGKVVDAMLREDDGKKKLWIKVLLNKDHPHFEEIFKSILNGFLDSFSIGFEVLKRKGSLITEIRILETSIVGIPANPDATVEEVIKGVSPKHPFKYGVDTESPWRKPRLQDFTDDRWEELSDVEKIFIEGHYAWSPKSPPDRFTDLKCLMFPIVGWMKSQNK